MGPFFAERVCQLVQLYIRRCTRVRDSQEVKGCGEGLSAGLWVDPTLRYRSTSAGVHPTHPAGSRAFCPSLAVIEMFVTTWDSVGGLKHPGRQWQLNVCLGNRLCLNMWDIVFVWMLQADTQQITGTGNTAFR